MIRSRHRHPSRRRAMSSRGLVLAGAALLLGAPPALWAQDWNTVTASRAYRGEEELRVDVQFGAGRLFLQPGPAGSLYKATVRYDADAFLPVTEYGDERLRLGLQSKRGVKVRGRQRAGRLDVALGPDAPLSIDLEFGAAQADIELGGLRVRRAEISTGASETTLRFSQPNPERLSALEIEVGAAALRAEGLGNANIERLVVDGGLGDVVLDFSGEWRGNTTADIDMGIGSLTLIVPKGVGLHVVKDGFLAPFDSEGLVKRGSGYYSLDWDTAPHRLTVRIDAAFGSIDVRWIEPSVTASRS